MKIRLGLVDDHKLVLSSLSEMLTHLGEFEVVVEAVNGKDLQDKIGRLTTLPDIILIDVYMPVMDGFATAAWLNEKHPDIKLVALTMNDSENTIIGMIKAGCCAYLLKDTSPEDLKKALLEITIKGFCNSDLINLNFRRLLLAEKEITGLNLSDHDIEFLRHICSDLTYKQIAHMMNMSERNTESLRNTLFHKFTVQSRTGLAIEAIKKGFVKVDNL